MASNSGYTYASAIPVVGSAFAGMGQQAAYDDLANQQMEQSNSIKLNRPVLGRTKGNIEAEQIARINNSTPNDAIYSLGQQQIERDKASRLRAITNSGASGGDIISGVVASDRAGRDANVGNLQAAYGRQYNNRQDLYAALGSKSAEELNIFDYNQNQPYQQDYLRKYNLYDASTRNRMLGQQAATEGMIQTGNNISSFGGKLAGSGLFSGKEESQYSGSGSIPDLGGGRSYTRPGDFGGSRQYYPGQQYVSKPSFY